MNKSQVKFYQNKPELLKVKSLVLHFFFLILKVLLNFCPDVCYKHNGFFKILLKKSLKLVLSKENNIIAFYSSISLLLIEVNFIAEEQNYKKDAFIAYSNGNIEIIFILSTKVVVFYIQAFII